ncbi:MAG: NigD-like protein [Paludibacter sp.]|nr:NigD-like protein [Paludibacter sp.]
MKEILFKVSFFVLAGLLFAGCSDDDFSDDNYWVDIATVENQQQKSKFFLHLDEGTSLWTEESNFSNYKPDDGQRVIAYYSVLSDKRATGLYDYDVKLHDVYEVLTKGVFEMTPAKQDSIGNDSIYVSDIWVGSKFLNVEFYYYGWNKTHFINLVSDPDKTYMDGKTHLEFRHNANNDEPYHRRWGIVSFDISSLQSNTADSVELVIHVNMPNQVEEKLFELTYRYNNNGSAGVVKKSRIQRADAYVRDNEVR